MSKLIGRVAVLDAAGAGAAIGHAFVESTETEFAYASAGTNAKKNASGAISLRGIDRVALIESFLPSATGGGLTTLR